MVKDKFGLNRPFVDEDGTGPLGLSRPFAQGTKMKLHGELQRFVEDEDKAGAEYMHTAKMAESIGYDGIAEKLKEAAEDEKRHNDMFQSALLELERDIDG